jgi:CRISPR/Cas system CSM-associated protein Csm3 (group 7 of RAMP superfamily)
LSEIRVGSLDLGQPDDLRMWLTLRGPELVDAVATRAVGLRPPAMEPLISVELAVVDGLLVAGDREGSHTRLYRRSGEPIIEGSSIKGVLRSRAEFILRSLGINACHGAAGACGDCPTCTVFGAKGHRGLVSVRSSVIRGPVERKREHVAIDRVTGGARAHQLFDEEVVLAGTLTLVVDAVGEVPAWVGTILQWVIRDLDDGLVGLGSRTTRGFGTVRVIDRDALGSPVAIPIREIKGVLV